MHAFINSRCFGKHALRWGALEGKNLVRSRERLSPHASFSQGVVIKYAPYYLLTRCTVVKRSIFHGGETCGARQSHTRRAGPAWEVKGGHHLGSDGLLLDLMS